MHYSHVAIILFSTELYKTAFSAYSFDFLLPKLPSAVPIHVCIWYPQIYIYLPTDILAFFYSYNVSFATFQHWSTFCCVTWQWNSHRAYRNSSLLQYFYWIFCATGYICIYKKTLCRYFLIFHSDVSHFTAFSNYKNLQHFITL